MSTSYPNTNLYIDGRWQPAASGDTIDVINPANEEVIELLHVPGHLI